jgi:hypothetical protein
VGLVQYPSSIYPFVQSREYHGYTYEDGAGQETPNFKECCGASHDVEEERGVKAFEEVVCGSKSGFNDPVSV